MGLYRAQVTEGEFVQEMQNAYPEQYTSKGLECIYRYVADNGDSEVFSPEEIHKEFTEYKGLCEYNTILNKRINNVDDVPGAIQFYDLNGFIVN